MNRASQARFEKQVMELLAANPRYHGIALDLEAIPEDAQPAYKKMVCGSIREDASDATAALHQRAGG